MENTIKQERVKGWLQLMRFRGGAALEVEAIGPHEWRVSTQEGGEARARVIGSEVEL
ncbi:hypothetical protein ACFLX5_05870 [Chloroflexota bacterium]